MSQAIYSFRGADYRNILNFQTDYPQAKIYNLEQNYRSTQNILDSAKNIIKNNSSHIPLDLWTEKSGGEKLLIYTAENEKAEAEFVVNEILNKISAEKNFKDFAVLYRTNAQSRNIEEYLIKANIPYRIVGGVRFYARKEIKDTVAFLRVAHNPKDSVSWERIINVPPRGLGKKSVAELKASGWDLDTIETRTKLPMKAWIKKAHTLATVELMDLILDDTGYLKWLDDKTEENLVRIENIKELRSVAAQFTELAEFLENVSLIESSDRPNMDDKNVVTLMTIHASKGLEFPVVFIIGMEEGLFPHARTLIELAELEEERRLCYVAITRAMEKVTLTNTFSRLYFGNVQVNMPSRFLSEIPENLTEIKSADGGPGFGFLRKKQAETVLDDLEYNRSNFSWE